jgi:hypothetical protein
MFERVTRYQRETRCCECAFVVVIVTADFWGAEVWCTQPQFGQVSQNRRSGHRRIVNKMRVSTSFRSLDYDIYKLTVHQVTHLPITVRDPSSRG